MLDRIIQASSWIGNQPAAYRGLSGPPGPNRVGTPKSLKKVSGTVSGKCLESVIGVFRDFLEFWGLFQGKKEYTPPPRDPSFLRRSPDPEVTEQKKLWCIPFSWGKQGKKVYTIGPERRVYTVEPQTQEKKKRRVSTVVVYTFFFPAFQRFRKENEILGDNFFLRCWALLVANRSHQPLAGALAFEAHPRRFHRKGAFFHGKGASQ